MQECYQLKLQPLKPFDLGKVFGSLNAIFLDKFLKSPLCIGILLSSEN